MTSYSQDPIHPERLQVTYLTRNKQRKDSLINIQYDSGDDFLMDEADLLHDEEDEHMGKQTEMSRTHTFFSRSILPRNQVHVCACAEMQMHTYCV